MYAIYAYIGVVWGVNVSIYSIHGVYGYCMGIQTHVLYLGTIVVEFVC